MAGSTSIEWTEQTWNPVTGCTKISPGCKHCYAETMANRLQAMGTPGYEHGFSSISLMYDRLRQPLQRKKPTVYFVNSMSDLFHDQVPFAFVDLVFDTIRSTPRHQYQVLTKRADRMADYFGSRRAPDNVWLGVSVENKKHGIPRIQYLQQIRAKIRFLSIEPLLEDVGILPLEGIHWVIVGGESGSLARPMAESWVINILDQCKSQDISFFFKQWGSWGGDHVKRAKRANGRELLGRTWDMIPLVEL